MKLKQAFDKNRVISDIRKVISKWQNLPSRIKDSSSVISFKQRYFILYSNLTKNFIICMFLL